MLFEALWQGSNNKSLSKPRLLNNSVLQRERKTNRRYQNEEDNICSCLGDHDLNYINSDYGEIFDT